MLGIDDPGYGLPKVAITSASLGSGVELPRSLDTEYPSKRVNPSHTQVLGE